MARNSPILPTRKPPNRWNWIALFSILLHVLGLMVIDPLLDAFRQDQEGPSSRPVSIRVDLPEPVPIPPEPEVKLQGQIVDIAQPADPKRPKDADYLAEHDRTTEEETRTQQYRVNPEILHEEYSTDDELKFEDLTNLDAKEPSTGAQVGNDRFDPDEDGSLASIPSPFQVTNKDGLQRPVPASHKVSSVAGAPNNDRLDLPTADQLALNANKIRFANYLNRIRRLVNFYWSQNLHNLPPAALAQLSRPMYETAVFVILDDSGTLESIEVTHSSGSRYVDQAVLRAFNVAGPFPNPPAQLIARDGRVYLPNFDFTVQMGRAQAAFQGIDPRAGVQFPGILKLNR
jgi:TonB family protein